MWAWKWSTNRLGGVTWPKHGLMCPPWGWIRGGSTSPAPHSCLVFSRLFEGKSQVEFCKFCNMILQIGSSTCCESETTSHVSFEVCAQKLCLEWGRVSCLLIFLLKLWSLVNALLIIVLSSYFEKTRIEFLAFYKDIVT